MLETFIEPEEIDPIYYDGRTYYLAPGTKSGQQPYDVFREAMEKMGRCGIATVTLTGKQHPVMIDVPKTKSNPQELKLAEQLIDASTTDHFDFGQFEDTQKDKLKELIQAKVKGKEIVAPTTEDAEAPATINLIDALKRSTQKSKRPERKRKKA